MKLSAFIDMQESGKIIYIGSSVGWLLAVHDKSEFETLCPLVDEKIITVYEAHYNDARYKAENWQNIVSYHENQERRYMLSKANTKQKIDDLVEKSKSLLNGEISVDERKAIKANTKSQIAELRKINQKLAKKIERCETSKANVIASVPKHEKRTKKYSELIKNYISLADREVKEYYEKTYCFGENAYGIGIIVEGSENFGTMDGLLIDERT